MKHADLVIIGAGPAGTSAAIEAAKSGIENIILLEQKELPRLKACAGGISSKAEAILDEMNLWEKMEHLIQPINSARLTYPSGKEIILAGEETASVVNRREFDSFLQNEAVSLGVTLLSSSKVISLEKNNGLLFVTSFNSKDNTTSRFQSPSVIVASGASNKFSIDSRTKTHITTCTAWFKDVDFDSNRLEMFFDKELAPHYGWLFPESDNTCNIGLCVLKKNIKGKSILDVYSSFLTRQLGSRMNRAVQFEEPKVHPIFPAWNVKNNSIEGTFLTGDAGRYINAYTGEGISYALISGRLAVKALLLRRKQNFSWRETSQWYEKQLSRDFGLKMKFGYSMMYAGPTLLKGSEIMMSIPFLKPYITKVMSKL